MSNCEIWVSNSGIWVLNSACRIYRFSSHSSILSIRHTLLFPVDLEHKTDPILTIPYRISARVALYYPNATTPHPGPNPGTPTLHNSGSHLITIQCQKNALCARLSYEQKEPSMQCRAILWDTILIRPTPCISPKRLFRESKKLPSDY